MSKKSTVNRKKTEEIGKFLQLVIFTTKEGISYEFFGTPIDFERPDSTVNGITFGPSVEKEAAIEYLRSGSKYLYEGMEGEGAWQIETDFLITDQGPRD
jgi:hypothetical protein